MPLTLVPLVHEMSSKAAKKREHIAKNIKNWVDEAIEEFMEKCGWIGRGEDSCESDDCPRETYVNLRFNNFSPAIDEEDAAAIVEELQEKGYDAELINDTETILILTDRC